jgi:hypothetical protein
MHQEQRLTFRLLSYWNRIRADKEMPALTDVNIHEITEMWHFSFTMDVSKPLAEHFFQYFGPGLAAIFGEDHTGDKVQAAMHESALLSNTLGFYEKVISTATPQTESSSFFMDGKEVRYRSLIVPLSSNGTAIDYVMGTTNYKIFD